MISRHKKKAYLGLGLWLGAPVMAFILGIIGAFIFYVAGAKPGPLVVVCFLSIIPIQYFAFFWGGSHLAKGKGYSTGLLFFGISWIAQPVILAILLFALPDKHGDPRRKLKNSHQDESQIDRIVRCRRNALVANVLGLAGVLAALGLILVHTGLFERQDNSRVVGIFIFVAGYAAIIYGCWWWVQAKNWNEAVVFIGLLPLAPLPIPFVRIFYLASGVMPLMMVIMPILMIGVVAALPDKSGMPHRKRRRQRLSNKEMS